ncbi:hypothetical protein ACFSJY_05130 [Thalassotalea euphylliae]|uniref:hypothetical protein n=1 Tax=Thalassotalea euphylliae TaxID=1655234 RepID=UPI00363EF4E3
MNLEELNSYLNVLHGPASVEDITVISGAITIKFNGDTGTKDKGEIELVFLNVEAVNLSFSLLAPVTIELRNDLITRYIESNYVDDGLNFYLLTDDVGAIWWVYARRYIVSVLPVLYK